MIVYREPRCLLIEGGLIIRHSGRLTGADLMNHSRQLFCNRAFDDAKYIVSDFSQITWSTFEESHGYEIGTYVREMRSKRIRLRRPFRWAVITADPHAEHLAGVIASGVGTDIYLQVFANFYEGLLWGNNPRFFTEIAKYAARVVGNSDLSDG